jgi:hypothetical protein
VTEGIGIESFLPLLQHDQHKNQEETPPPESVKTSWQPSKVKESLVKLQELSMMFSRDESDVVNRSSRGGDDSDAGSIKSNVPTSVKNRGQTKRAINGN